ncbi:uncharacterized protein METZ01_LOCUS141770, partial [marine metagenome]
VKRKIDMQRAVTPAKFAHFVLRVRDIEKSIDWYQKVLGMTIVHDAGNLAFMTYDDEHHRLALAKTPVETETVRGSPGLDHVAYTLTTLGELLGTYVRLKSLDIEPVWPVNHGLTTSLYYADPDGNRVEFQVENFDSTEELNAFMRSSVFAENPIGVEFDPDRLLERYCNGDSLQELRAQGSA